MKHLLALAAVLLAAAPAAAGLHPALDDHLAAQPDDALVGVLVVLADQADIPALSNSLRGAKAGRGTRHQAVLETLRTKTFGTQGPLLDVLRAARRDGRVGDFTSHWLINAVSVTATRGFVRELAARPDVGPVEFLPEFALVEPVPGVRAARVDSGTVGTTPGLEAINVRRVWEELGIDGTGTLVGIIDTGVDVSHPALGPRWRGNRVPLEHAWHDPINTPYPYPTDFDINGHGTHVMGTILGRAPGDTIGVAPGAEWIASNAINTIIGRVHGNVLSALEFMTDPDGDPATTDDVPHVVQNSWGVYEGFPGFYDCDSSWYEAIDNCEAAGVVLVWSAGNEGPFDQTVRSPADRAATFTNAFSVGATDAYAPFEAAPWSSRGPSGCRGPYEVKPEVAAPGVEILSASPGGGYHHLSGTSMAGPHVAGVVALMRQANPDLEVAAIKEILMATARDLGEPGEDNTYGHGLIDAYAAVLAVMNTVGSVAGTVTDAVTGQPLAGVTVGIDGRDHRAVTDADGRWKLTMVAEYVSFTARGFEHHPGSFGLTVPVGKTVVHDLALARLPNAAVTGRVLDLAGDPVVGAAVGGVGAPVAPAVTDEDGRYVFRLPMGPGRIYELRAFREGMGPDYHVLELTGDAAVDFRLGPDVYEDFEQGGALSAGWQSWGDAPWYIETADAHQGAWSASSGDVRNGQWSSLEREMYVSGASEMSFWHRISSEKDFDYLLFYVDGELKGAWSGEGEWRRFALEIPRGHHHFAWVYRKDEAFSRGEDRALIDLIRWPVSYETMVPRMNLGASVLATTLGPGQKRVVPLRLENDGDLALNFSVVVGPDLGKSGVEPYSGEERRNPIPHFDLDKGERDPRLGPAPVEGAGGPDVYGYTWEDQTWFGGPVYDWTDIRFDGGTGIGLRDDDLAGPIPLGFTFRFYGSRVDSIWIGSNGNLLVAADDATFVNQGIPDPFAPNGMIAPFWDDLDPGAGGSVSYRSDPEAGRFIVQWQDVPRYETGAEMTFQAILERDGTILFQYADVPEPVGGTVGIESPDGADGIMIQFNAPIYLEPGRVVRFTAPAAWVLADRPAGVVAPDRALDLGVEFDATGLAEGVHAAMMTITSDDPARPRVEVPLILTVNSVSAAPDPDLPRVFAFAGAVPNPFNPSTELHFSLPRPADVSLRLYDVSGRLVRVLHEGALPAGDHHRRWDGRDDGGRAVASGAYYARLVTPEGPITKSLALVR
jgi:subtilisin family serine protease